MNKAVIREFTISDLESISYLKPEGWDDITGYFKFYYSEPFCHPVVAVIDNKIVGTASAILNRDTGWIAHIIVSPDHRRQGIGYQLTETVLNILTDHKCKTKFLIATKEGEPLYKKLGFRVSCYYRFFRHNSLLPAEPDVNIRLLTDNDYDNIFELDFEITKEYRHNMLKRYISSGYGYFHRDTKQLRGYFLPEPGEGTVIARDNEAGLKLLAFKHSLKSGRSVIPETNQEGIEFLISNGMEEFYKAARMFMGEKLDCKLSNVYSRIGGYYA